MYGQGDVHPVSRGGEVRLNLALRRAKDLHEEGYVFQQAPKYFIPFFDGTLTVHDYLRLDEMVVNFYLQEWIHEDDEVLSDLSHRFVNRDLRSEEHTSELQSRGHLVCRLLLDKKKPGGRRARRSR